MIAASRRIQQQHSPFTARKLPVAANGAFTGFSPHVTSLTDYYPFGSGMAGRTVTEGYRYGFNAMEREDDLYAPGSAYDFGARMYDGRLGRWWSVDPLAVEYPMYSPFTFAADNPVSFIDPDGERINWFRLRAALIARKTLISTPTGEGVWKMMRKSGSRINLHIVPEVLTLRTGPVNGVNQNNIVAGLTVPRVPGLRGRRNPNADEFARDRRGNLKTDKTGRYYYASVDVFVSTGTFELVDDIQEQQGVPNFYGLSQAQRQVAVRNQLATGSYQVLEPSLTENIPLLGMTPNTLTSVDPNANVSLANGVMGFVPNQAPIPNASESRDEYLNRIFTHEGTHSYNDAQENGSPVERRRGVETLPTENESKTIEQQR